MKNFIDLFGGFNKSVLSLENKAVYGMVDKSCHEHSGPLFYVALPRLNNAAVTPELDPASSVCTNEMMKHSQGDPCFEEREVHIAAPNIVLLLQKPLAHTRCSPRGKKDREKHKKKISKEINITNKEEITAVH